MNEQPHASNWTTHGSSLLKPAKKMAPISMPLKGAHPILILVLTAQSRCSYALRHRNTAEVSTSADCLSQSLPIHCLDFRICNEAVHRTCVAQPMSRSRNLHLRGQLQSCNTSGSKGWCRTVTHPTASP